MSMSDIRWITVGGKRKPVFSKKNEVTQDNSISVIADFIFEKRKDFNRVLWEKEMKPFGIIWFDSFGRLYKDFDDVDEKHCRSIWKTMQCIGLCDEHIETLNVFIIRRLKCLQSLEKQEKKL